MKISTGVALMSLLLALPCSYASDRWLDGKADGYFWYQDPAEELEEEEPTPPPTKATPPPAPLAKQEPSPPAGPAPLSSAWIRENMQKYLDAAMDNPKSPEHVAAFLYLQRYAMDKSFTFMDSVNEVTTGHSVFDEINRRPTATYGNKKLDEVATKNFETSLAKIASQSGLFVFYDNTQTSLTQSKVVDMVTNQFDFSVIRLAKEKLSAEFNPDNIRPDNGHSTKLGITTYPAIAIMSASGEFDVVSQAAVSLSDLHKRVLLGAKRLGIIGEKEFNDTRPIQNIGRNISLQKPSAVSGESQVPIQPSQLLRMFEGDK